MKELIEIWDRELIERHIGSEIRYINDFFVGKTKLTYIDIGANVGKFYDVLSKKYEIEKVIMVEPAPKLFEYISDKFKEVKNCKIYDFAISDETGETFFETHSLDHSTNEHINMGLLNLFPVIKHSVTQSRNEGCNVLRGQSIPSINSDLSKYLSA